MLALHMFEIRTRKVFGVAVRCRASFSVEGDLCLPPALPPCPHFFCAARCFQKSIVARRSLEKLCDELLEEYGSANFISCTSQAWLLLCLAAPEARPRAVAPFLLTNARLLP